MTNEKDVKNALKAITGAAPHLKSAKGAGRIFELFIMTGIARELKSAGFAVSIHDADGAPFTGTFKQKGVPCSDITKGGSFIRFTSLNSKQEWEIWNGIQFTGRSMAKHEIDLAIVPKELGDNLRSNSSSNAIGRPRVAIECKDVTRVGNLDEIRTLVARLYDLTLLRTHHKDGLHPHLSPSGYCAMHPGVCGISGLSACNKHRDENARTLNVLARRTGFASGVAPLAKYYHIRTCENIANTHTALFKSITDWIKRFL